jgi:hypothetical protein
MIHQPLYDNASIAEKERNDGRKTDREKEIRI